MKPLNQRHVATAVAITAAALLFAVLTAQGALSVFAAVAAACACGMAICGGCLVWRLRAQNAELRRLDRAKDDFIASVSHELRTPLTSIRGYLELVLDGDAGDLTDDQQRYLSVVDRNADRLLRVVGDLLFAAQVDARKIALDARLTDLEELVVNAVEAVRPQAAEYGVQLALDSDGPAELVCDEARLGQILDNLLANAVKFTPPGGRVEVRTLRQGEAVVVEVADTGIGISAEDQELLFQPFFRGQGAIVRAIEGTGLGLTIVKAIVDAHGGELSVRSAADKGTTVRIALPLERSHVQV